MKLYNSLTKSVDELRPYDDKKVGMYICGPTVYDYAHIGHMRKYVGDDLIVRTLKYLGFEVKTVMNITDVGHLVSDADEGEDKMEKGARKHGLDVWQVARRFEDHFFKSTEALNVMRPDKVMRATDYIEEQVALISRLEEKGFTYLIDDGVYFDTSKMPDYGAMSDWHEEQVEARVEENQQKKKKQDFALWKLSPKGVKRQMEWDSPWGKGFPGWHIECSAMSMLALGEQFEIHTGGIDHKQIHHPNEIAQSEAATGKKPFVKYWVHHNFLHVNGEKMSKSKGNLYTIEDVKRKGIEPLALRYQFLQTHYRKEINFTWDNLEASREAWDRLGRMYGKFEAGGEEGEEAKWEGEFREALENDFNFPKALAVVWELVKSDEREGVKKRLIERWDQVLGLKIDQIESEASLPAEIVELVRKREEARSGKNFELADELRTTLEKKGYEVEDEVNGTSVRRKH